MWYTVIVPKIKYKHPARILGEGVQNKKRGYDFYERKKYSPNVALGGDCISNFILDTYHRKR